MCKLQQDTSVNLCVTLLASKIGNSIISIAIAAKVQRGKTNLDSSRVPKAYKIYLFG